MAEDTQMLAVYTAVSSLADEIAGMIAAWFCRVPEESDHDLALKIIARLVMPGCDHEWDQPGRDPDWYIAQQGADAAWHRMGESS